MKRFAFLNTLRRGFPLVVSGMLYLWLLAFVLFS